MTQDEHLLILSLFFFLLLYLSSLRDLACGGGLLLDLSLPISGFLQGPLPGQHGFDGFFDGPTINLLVLKIRDKKV